MNRLRAAALLLGLAACGRQDVQKPQPPPPPAAKAPPTPWTWHPMGGWAAVEGELAEPTDLVLEGRSIRETRFAEPGPVRWEFFRPPKGETAVLRTAAGEILARFDFTVPPAKSTLIAPKVARHSAPPDALPSRSPQPRPGAALPVAPRTTAGTRLPPTLTAPLAARRQTSLPESPMSTATAGAAPTPHESHFVLPSAPLPSASRTALWPGIGEALNLTRGPGGHKRLLLSFDGGSTSEVAADVLDTLKARGVHTTIFLTGAFIQRYPGLVKRMAAEGHELGNHTMNHPHFAPGMKRDPKWTRDRVQRELLEADAALVRLLGRPMDPFWRAPYGEHTPEIRRWAEEIGYRHVGWSEGADTLDWATPKERHLYRSGGAILQRLQRRLDRDGDGLIVLMHLGSERVEGDRPSAGLGTFMDRARSQGWAFVTASAYLRDLGKPAWDPQQRLTFLQTPGSAPISR